MGGDLSNVDILVFQSLWVVETPRYKAPGPLGVSRHPQCTSREGHTVPLGWDLGVVSEGC